MENDRKKWLHFYSNAEKKGKEKINIKDIFKINTLFKIKIMKYVIKSSYILFEM